MAAKVLFLGLSLTLALGCGGSSKSDGDGAHPGGAAGTAGGKGGTFANGGTSTSEGGHQTAGGAGRATTGGSSSGGSGGRAGAAAGGTAGTAGTSGRIGGGRGGRGQAGSGSGGSAGHVTENGGAAGEATAGAAGVSGAAGNDQASNVCGGLSAKTCDPGEWCHWANGSCGAGDQQGQCTSDAGGACAPGAVCGCDGRAYTMACRAASNGVDTTGKETCVPGNGALNDPCFVDTDCSGALKCCSSPIGLMSCTTAPGGSCPLTP